jgi:hypothetical protein
MSTNNSDYLHLTSNKFAITCKTCGITETFYSELSVGYFRLIHGGHEFVETAHNRRPWGRANAVLHAVLDATTVAPSLDAAVEESPGLDVTTEEAPSLEVPTKEAPSLDTATEVEPSLEATTEEAPSLKTATEDDASFNATTEEFPSLDTTTERAPSLEATTEEAPSLETATEEASSLDATRQTVEIGRVLVVTRASPVDGLPVIQVRGANGDGKTCFVVLFKHEEIGKMRQFLGSGRYQDGGLGNTVYTWEVDAIHFEEQWAERLIPTEPKNDGELQESDPRADSVRSSMDNLNPAPAPEPEMSLEPAPSTSVRTERPRPAQNLRPALAPEPAPSISLRTERPRPAQNLAPAPAPALEESPKPAAPASPRTEKPKRAKNVVVVQKKPAPKAAPASAPLSAPAAKPARKDDETILLAKSSYIQEGEENRREAIRISKILKAFRWNVEPVYTIGVILDDNLSIETNKGEITGDLVKQIEGMGYKLSGLNANSGRPTAWFKKKPSLRVPVVADSERSRELQDRVEQLSNTLQEERKRANEQKAIWEERFRLLMKLVKSTNSEPETGSVSDGSEPQPEPDVVS